MSAQDKTEEILRQMHILLAGSEAYDSIGSKIILDKKRMLELLAELNKAIYAMLDEYELTTRGKERARREAAKIGEDILKDASGKAEDVYAASVMYTNEALRHVQEIMQRATDAMQEIYKDANEKLQKEKDVVRRDQSDLKGHLQNLADTDKYLNLIEDRNREIEKERAKEKGEVKPSPYSAIKPEIKINQEYFEKAGIVPENELPEEIPEDTPEEAAPKAEVNVNVNLDAEYFHWKEGGEASGEKKPEKHSFFSRHHKEQKENVMLEKPEEKEYNKKWESLYVFTGRRSDLTTMISIAVINPMILYVFIGYVAGKRISLPVLYLIIDGVLFLQWGLLVKRRKRKIEQSIQDVAGQMDTIREKINELGN